MPFEYMASTDRETTEAPDVPETEMEFDFARAGGPGGQNVNKRETKAIIKWHVDRSRAFDDDQKALIKLALVNRMNKEGYLIVTASAERSQDQNRSMAMETLRALVSRSLAQNAERIATKPTRSSQRARLDEKTIRSRQKQDRGRKNWDE
jgi:ribosome-associated protein